MQGLEGGVISAKRTVGLRKGARFRIMPGLFIDHKQQIEGVEQEVPRAAGRIQNLQVARVFLVRERNVCAIAFRRW